MQRYFVNRQENHSFILSVEDSYHILVVMRMKIGDKIEIVSKERLYLCEIDKIITNKSQDLVEAKIIHEIASNTSLPVKVILAQSIVQENKMDYILQKATELGVKAIQPFVANRSMINIKGKENKRILRWQKIVKEASEQSKGLLIPEVKDIMNIDDLCKVDCEVKLFCSVNETSTTLKKVLANITNDVTMICVVGPEGGFTVEEENKLLNSGYCRVSLGNRVLRTETVGLYIMSVINYNFMR